MATTRTPQRGQPQRSRSSRRPRAKNAVAPSTVKRLIILNKTLGVLSLIGWVFFIIALYMFHYATPDPDNFYDTILDTRPNASWDATYADMFIFFMSVGILVSLVALALNIYLYRAKRTHIWVNLMLLLATGAGILGYFIRAYGS